jgi:hypothetical protein
VQWGEGEGADRAAFSWAVASVLACLEARVCMRVCRQYCM